MTVAIAPCILRGPSHLSRPAYRRGEKMRRHSVCGGTEACNLVRYRYDMHTSICTVCGRRPAVCSASTELSSIPTLLNTTLVVQPAGTVRMYCMYVSARGGLQGGAALSDRSIDDGTRIAHETCQRLTRANVALHRTGQTRDLWAGGSLEHTICA